MLAKAIRPIATGAEQVADTAVGLAAGFGGETLLPVAAYAVSAFKCRPTFRGLGVGADDAAGGISVEGGVRTTNYFNTLQTGNIQM